MEGLTMMAVTTSPVYKVTTGLITSTGPGALLCELYGRIQMGYVDSYSGRDY